MTMSGNPPPAQVHQSEMNRRASPEDAAVHITGTRERGMDRPGHASLRS